MARKLPAGLRLRESGVLGSPDQQPDQPPELASDANASALLNAPRGWTRRALLYPGLYLWYIAFAAMDISLTWIILSLGGREVNALADWIIQRFQLPGVVVFKFFTVVLVVVICEAVGRRKPDTGVRLCKWAVILTSFPVVVGAVHLLRHVMVHRFG